MNKEEAYQILSSLVTTEHEAQALQVLSQIAARTSSESTGASVSDFNASNNQTPSNLKGISWKQYSFLKAMLQLDGTTPKKVAAQRNIPIIDGKWKLEQEAGSALIKELVDLGYADKLQEARNKKAELEKQVKAYEEY